MAHPQYRQEWRPITPDRRRRWAFRPALAPTLAAALLLPVLLALADWQWHRAADKIALREHWAAQSALPPLRLSSTKLGAGDPFALAGRPVIVRGRWQAEHQVLLDNQVADGQVGYRVFTPLRLPDGTAVLVDRGWVPAPPRRDEAPDVGLTTQDAVAAGVASPAPVPGPFARQDIDASLGSSILRVQLLDPPALSQRLGLDLAPWTLRLDPAAPDGYRRRWPPPGGLTPERHRAYAVQWFALAALLVIVYVKLNLRRI